ncbi:MAG: twin-arginine translocation signal domain-containing protein [Aquificaceae bacterium]
MELTRRSFLKVAGVSAGATLAGGRGATCR